MITLCRIILAVVSCTTTAPAPAAAPKPADAIAILTASVPSGTLTRTYDGPTVIGIPSSVTAGPYGEFPPFPESRRLDGSLWTDPPWILHEHVGYGFRGGAGRAREGRSERSSRE